MMADSGGDEGLAPAAFEAQRPRLTQLAVNPVKLTQLASGAAIWML